MDASTAQPQQAAAASSSLGLSTVLDELTKKTIDILGRVLKKPPLTQKLLAKPPFRYLHDIFSELIRTHGFAPSLYTDTEMNSSNIKDKEGKVQYLTKMVDCIGIATGLEIRANPLKIVAGLDPEETNAMLQLIGKMVIKKVDTKNAIARVLAGEHQRAKPLSATPITGPKSAERKPIQDNTPKAPQLVGSKLNETDANVSAPIGNPETSKAKSVAVPNLQPSAVQPDSKSFISQEDVKSKPSDLNRSVHTLPNSSTTIANTAQNDPSSRIQPPSVVLKPDDKKHQTLEKNGSFPDMAVSEVPDKDDGSTTASQLSHVTIKRRERPISARAAPPKQRSTQISSEEIPKETLIIIPDGKHKDDEDDEFVAQAIESLNKGLNLGSTGFEQNKKHALNPDYEILGGLVNKILQTKKDLEGEPGNSDSERTSTTISKDPKGSAVKDIEELRESIQLLCKSTNPLSKTMDYMQEDVDSMNKELEIWRKESQSFKVMRDAEEQLTLESLVPLETQLKSISSSIDEQYEKIATTKEAIIQNDIAIQKILRGITTANK
ncbi:hypothetical protein BASA50_007300 [Batrachochytrium salamandrivorans]|uniref:TRAF3-interacting protein 1 N-terminal domain-containing protein n=1 Tax=Batrachochytrium salamandrivorans TaxID=1357716 RepID=A0ABQ8FAH0_9FUNG|nr:hypothetical protein BASA50_007300 [Batrachochytrium salamandrivorans]